MAPTNTMEGTSGRGSSGSGGWNRERSSEYADGCTWMPFTCPSDDACASSVELASTACAWRMIHGSAVRS